MSSDPEDDALSWDGDDALDARRTSPRPQKRDDIASPEEKRADATAPASADAPSRASVTGASEVTAVAEDDEYQGIGTAALVGLGILGGIYLLYTVGWFLGGAGMQAKAMFMLPAPLYLASLWIAILAPGLWFASALVLTRGGKTWVRFAALIVGALLLVPWPFVVAGGGGAL